MIDKTYLHENPDYVKSQVIGVLGMVFIIYHLWYAYTFGLIRDKHLVIHVMTMMIGAVLISFDTSAIDSDDLRTRIDNLVILPIEALLAIVAGVYIFANYDRLALTAFGIYTDVDLLIGIILIVLVLDLTRRTLGWVLAGVGILGLVYAIWGPYFPSIFNHSGVRPRRLVTSLTVEFSGLYDTLVAVSATYIILFLFFAGFLEAFGALDYFVDSAKRIAKYVESGITQIAVITSLAMASINGSATANAATTGAFTIPTIKRRGVDADSAAAIESVASTGGQIMPPVMGAAAFLIAEFTGTRYVDIIFIAIIPALIFYMTVSFSVYLISKKSNIISESELEDEEQEARATRDMNAIGRPVSDYAVMHREIPVLQGLVNGVYLWLPVAVLVYTLVVLRFGAQLAAFWGIVTAVGVMAIQSFVFNNVDVETVKTVAGNVIDGSGAGLMQAAPIALATAAMAFFVEVLSMTGFSLVFAQQIVNFAGGELALLLLFSMMGAILFGLGMPTTAAYIVSVLLIAPALTQVGIEQVTAHMFVFYFAILSAITPPVAIVCIVTSQIAGGNFLRTCYKSIVIALPLFILPFSFVFNPSLLYWDGTTLTTFLFVAIAKLILVIALVDDRRTYWFRGPVFVGGLLLIFTSLLPIDSMSDINFRISVCMILLLIIAQRYGVLRSIGARYRTT